MTDLRLKSVDRLEVTVLVDNYTDVLALQGSDVVQRAMIPPSAMPLLAEHGLSCLLSMSSGPEQYQVLLDTGMSPICLFHNAEKLGIDLSAIDTLVLSHGHFDHFGGLHEFLDRARGEIDLVMHPSAFLQRRIAIPPDIHADMPWLDPESIKGPK